MSESRRDFLRQAGILTAGSLAVSVLPARKTEAFLPAVGRIVLWGTRFFVRKLVGKQARKTAIRGSRSWINLGSVTKYAALGVAAESVISVSPRIAKAMGDYDIDYLMVSGDNNEILLKGDKIEPEQQLSVYIQQADLKRQDKTEIGPFPLAFNSGDNVQVQLSQLTDQLNFFDVGAWQTSARTTDESLKVKPSPRYLVADESEVRIHGD